MRLHHGQPLEVITLTLTLMPAQVIEDAECVRLHDGQPLEAVITEKLRHPNLVAALDYATVPGRDPYNPHDETWLLLDFCDRGSLIVRPAVGL